MTLQRALREAPVVSLPGLIVLAVLLSTQLDHFPFFDALMYADCVTLGAEQATLESLRCIRHHTQSFVGPLAVLQRLAPGTAMLVIGSGLFGALQILSLAVIDARLRPEGDQVERALLGVLLAVHPVTLANTVQLSPDIGMAAYVLATTAAVIWRRYWWAAAIGVLVPFAKESGALTYAGIYFSWVAVWMMYRDEDGLRIHFHRVVKTLPLTLPGILFALYLVAQRFGGSDVMWTGTSKVGWLAIGYARGSGASLVNYLLGMYVMNFQWLLTLAIVGGAATLIRRGWPEGTRRWDQAWVFIHLLVMTYMLTRYLTYTNMRYNLCIYPIALLAGAVSLQLLTERVAVRRAILAGIAVLWGLSCFRTVDPVSKLAFGTWQWGEHEMLYITKRTQECCGYGRDQLVYNLEFTHISDMLGEAMHDQPPRRGMPWVVPEETRWHIWGLLEPDGTRKLRQHTKRRGGGIGHLTLLQKKKLPKRIVLVEMPMATSPARSMLEGRGYRVAEERRYERDGYPMTVVRLTR